jgi:hypothetical protein
MVRRKKIPAAGVIFSLDFPFYETLLGEFLPNPPQIVPTMGMSRLGPLGRRRHREKKRNEEELQTEPEVEMELDVERCPNQTRRAKLNG